MHSEGYCLIASFILNSAAAVDHTGSSRNMFMIPVPMSVLFSFWYHGIILKA